MFDVVPPPPPFFHEASQPICDAAATEGPIPDAAVECKKQHTHRMKQKHNVSVEGLDIEISTGTLAGLASGAVTIRPARLSSSSQPPPPLHSAPGRISSRSPSTTAKSSLLPVNSPAATSSAKASHPKRKSSPHDFATVHFVRSSRRAS